VAWLGAFCELHATGRKFGSGARILYCDMPGSWTWMSAAPHSGLQQAGSFSVLSLGSLPGKLQAHVKDRRQLQYANGSAFLHLGDTGYRYLVDSEPLWKRYIDQSAQAGATKIRVWFCKGRHDINAVFEWGATNQTLGLALPYWQEMDRRLLYALEAHPSVQLEVIVYGEDRARIRAMWANTHRLDGLRFRTSIGC
jgi:hypothetical protein